MTLNERDALRLFSLRKLEGIGSCVTSELVSKVKQSHAMRSSDILSNVSSDTTRTTLVMVCCPVCLLTSRLEHATQKLRPSGS